MLCGKRPKIIRCIYQEVASNGELSYLCSIGETGTGIPWGLNTEKLKEGGEKGQKNYLREWKKWFSVRHIKSPACLSYQGRLRSGLVTVYKSRQSADLRHNWFLKTVSS